MGDIEDFKVGDIVEIIYDPCCVRDCCPNGNVGSQGKVNKNFEGCLEVEWLKGDCVKHCFNHTSCHWYSSIWYKLKKVQKMNRNGANKCI